MPLPVSYPGVYIQEFAPGAPIEGVGTSTAAFLGPSAAGPLNQPVKVTNWEQFLALFGEEPLANFYLWYAVRGYFENGGQVCYITRVSNASFDELVLNDLDSDPTIRLYAREVGDLSPSIEVTVDQDDPAVSNAEIFRNEATVTDATGTVITVSDAAQAARFRPGDVIRIEAIPENATVQRIQGNEIRLTTALEGTANAGVVRLADTTNETTVLRLESAEALSSGGVIVLTQGGDTATVAVRSVASEVLAPGVVTQRVTLRQALGQVFDLSSGADAVDVDSVEFRLQISQGGDANDYRNLSMDSEHPRYFRRIVNEDPDGLVFADPVEPPNTTAAPGNRPANVNVATALAGGTDDNPAALNAGDYSEALAQLQEIDDINMVAVPDRTDLAVQLAVIAHCENMHDRFALLDSRRGAPLFGTDSVELHRAGLDTARGFASLYYPWLQVAPANGGDLVLVPPTGHVAGVYARIDNQRGVHKAPAGTEALLNGVLGVERNMSDVDQGQLNLQGINVMRVFKPGGRAVIWGARTTATDTNWQYVNVRRLFLFLEESIEEGIRWAVFEPNNLQLWQKLKRTVTEFLTRVWRDGALFGATADEAFYVRIDDALNPPSEQALGRLNMEIGVRPSYPAEFIIVRIGITRDAADISES